MKIIRYIRGNDPPTFGWLNDNAVGPIEGNPLSDFRRLDANTEMHQIKLLPPIQPRKIIGIAYNYASRANELEITVPETPMMYMKPPSSIIGPKEYIEIPPQSQKVEHEANLAVVIGHPGRWITPDEALNYVFGYTAVIDATARDILSRDGQWVRAKGFDTFCPVGPVIETDLDATDILFRCTVNGELRQMTSTYEMLFTIPQIIAFISSVMTLSAGDLILTGTPSGVDQLKQGDTIELSIDGVGTLENFVRQQKPI